MTPWYVVAHRLGPDRELSARLCVAIKENDLVHDVAEVLVQAPTLAMLQNPKLRHYCAVGVGIRTSAQALATDVCPRVCDMLRACPGLEVAPRFWSREDVVRHFRADRDFAALKATLGASIPIAQHASPREEHGDDRPAEPVNHVVRPERTSDFDALLAWATATGKGRLPKLADACRALGLADTAEEVRSIRRRLTLLGHLTVSSDGTEWAIRRATAVPLVADSSRLFLCGQRLPRLLHRLLRDAAAEVLPQPGSDGPSRVVLPNSPEVRAIVTECTAGIQTAILTQPLPLDDVTDPIAWCRDQSTIEPPTANACTLEVFDGRSYCPVQGVVFDSAGAIVLESGLYRLGGTAERAGTPCLYDASANLWITGDWYGLRFMARRLAGRDAPTAAFDRVTSILTIPRGWEFPMAHERALVLSSGQLPLVTREVRQYEGIAPNVASLVCEKLGVTMADVECRGDQSCAMY